MRIRRITVKNFRSFDAKGVSFELPNLKVPFSVVGHNNSGKSNLINAVCNCIAARSTPKHTFAQNDFHMRKTDSPILIEVLVDDPLKSSDAYNSVKEMPLFQLIVTEEEGVFSVSHYLCDARGKQIFNPRSVKRSKTKAHTDEEKEILNEAQKKGAEQVWRWRSKIPAYYIDTMFIQGQLKINNYTLLGKVIEQVKADFESKSNLMPDAKGVVQSHVGKPRQEVFENAMAYLEDYVLSTESLESLISNIESVIKKQLNIEGEGMSLKFGFPSADTFFNNLTFYITDNPKKPKLPIDQMGKGFSSLFVVALFRAILSTDEVGGNIFIIEEPETFLHEHFQEYFYNVLCDLSQKNQVIYTTHSKKFVNVFEPKSIVKLSNDEYLHSRVVYKEEPDVTYPSVIDCFDIKSPDDFAKYLRTLEPNLGNVIFAHKVLIVEGPDDLMAYITVFSEDVNFGLNNIAVVAAWGKDTIKTLVQLCKRFEIDFFVVHDWDLTDEDVDITSEPVKENATYAALNSVEKAQFTKNHNIYEEVGYIDRIHHNKRNLESVLKIDTAQKGTISVYKRLKDENVVSVLKKYPKLVDENLLAFLGLRVDKGTKVN